MSDYIVLRDVTPDECSWLRETVPAGTQVKRFYGVTYGCISPWGLAFSYTDGHPFFELPRTAVKAVAE